MKYLKPEQIEDFFKKYLALFGFEGGSKDFHQVRKWVSMESGYYPDIFQRRWPIELRYGYEVMIDGKSVARPFANGITDENNFRLAITSYRKWLKDGKYVISINVDTGEETKIKVISAPSKK